MGKLIVNVALYQVVNDLIKTKHIKKIIITLSNFLVLVILSFLYKTVCFIQELDYLSTINYSSGNLFLSYEFYFYTLIRKFKIFLFYALIANW